MSENALSSPGQTPPKPAFQLKRLSAKHKQAAALLAQGLGRAEIAKAVDFTPEYITMLSQQTVFIQYVKEMTAFSDVRLQALFEKSVDVLGNSMMNGSEHVKLEAAKSVLKAVGKDGTSDKGTKVEMNFIVKIPTKDISSDDWAARIATRGRTLENTKP